MPLTSQVLDPGQQGENNLYNVTWAGDPYLSAATGVTATNLLRPPTIDQVERSWNRSFTNTKFLMGLPKIACADYKDVWMENPFMDSPVVVRAGAGAVANGGQGNVEQTIPVTDATFGTVGIKHKLVYEQAPGQPITHATVIAKAGTPGAYTVTVRSYNGQSLPAVTTGQRLGNSGPRQGDNEPMPATSFRDTRVQFWNGMEELGGFFNRWDPKDSARWDSLNQGYKAAELRNTQTKFYNAIGQTIMIGNGGDAGRTTLSDGRMSFATKGIIPQLERAGVGVTATTAGGFTNIMRESVHDLQLEDDTNKWLLIAPGRVLDAIGLSEKAERVRYTYGDHTFDSTITAYNYWGHTVVPLRMNIMQNVGMFGDSFKNRAILIRESQLKLTYKDNWPMFSKYVKLANNQNSNPATGFANIDAAGWYAMFGVRVEYAWSAAMFDILN